MNTLLGNNNAAARLKTINNDFFSPFFLLLLLTEASFIYQKVLLPKGVDIEQPLSQYEF